MGLANVDFTSMDQITDVEAKGYYQEYIQTKSHEEAFKTILAGTREHTRILLPWNKNKPEYHKDIVQVINTKITNIYKELIALRKDQTFVYGDFKVLNKKKNHFTYSRKLNNEYVIDCNLSNTTQKAYQLSNDYECIFAHTKTVADTLNPYETRIYKKK